MEKVVFDFRMWRGVIFIRCDNESNYFFKEFLVQMSDLGMNSEYTILSLTDVKLFLRRY